MMKVNIESRTIRVPAPGLPVGTYFRYEIASRDELCEEQSGVMLVTNIPGKAVNLYSGTVVLILDIPYEVINDIELKGWV